MPSALISVLCTAFVLWLLVPADASAADRTITASLDWQRHPGTEGCLDREGIVAAVEARLGRVVFVDGQADVLLAGRAVRSEQAPWTIELVLTAKDGRALGRRELNSAASDCSALDD
jgi:hypothetical protein